MKNIVKFITEARGYSAVMTTINEWIDMSRKPHDTKLYCVIGRDDESLDGYIICVNIESTPYQIDAFYLTESQLKQLYKPNVSRYIAVVVTSSCILAKTSRLELNEINISLDEVKLMKQILQFKNDYLMKKNIKFKLLQNNK